MAKLYKIPTCAVVSGMIISGTGDVARVDGTVGGVGIGVTGVVAEDARVALGGVGVVDTDTELDVISSTVDADVGEGGITADTLTEDAVATIGISLDGRIFTVCCKVPCDAHIQCAVNCTMPCKGSTFQKHFVKYDLLCVSMMY